MHDISILFHPDCTVGYGISPYQPSFDGSWTLPPVGNLTPPREFIFKFIIALCADLSIKKH